MSEAEHGKIYAFLLGEFNRKEGRQCVRFDLYYAPQGYREEQLRSWVREETPELFDDVTKVEGLASEILEIAEGHADAFGMGNHRYVIRTFQHLSGRSQHSFKMAPSFVAGSEPGEALAVRGGGAASSAEAALSTLTQNNSALMRTNQAMFQQSLGVIAGIAEDLRSENAVLKMKVTTLEHENAELKSNKDDKDLQTHLTLEAHQRKAKTFEMITQLGSIAVAKMAGGDAAGAQSGIGMLLARFGESLRQDQIGMLFQVLDNTQKLMFMEIMNMVRSQQSAPNVPGSAPPKGPPAPNGANGAHT